MCFFPDQENAGYVGKDAGAVAEQSKSKWQGGSASVIPGEATCKRTMKIIIQSCLSYAFKRHT